MDRKKYLNAAELGRFFKVIDSLPADTPSRRRKKKRDQLLFRLTYVLGLRKSEAVAIRLDDVDEEEKRIRIPRMKRKDKDRIKHYYLDSDLLRLYKDYRRVRDAYHGTFGNPYLFITGMGRASGHIDAETVYGLFKLYAKAAGLPEYYSPHSLRHSCAIMMALRGASAIVVQKRLGHYDPSAARAYVEFAGDEAKQIDALTNKILEL